MNIFEKRPLALILCIGLCGFFLFTFDDKIFRLILIAISFLPIIIFNIFKVRSEFPVSSKAITLTLVVSFLFSYIYFDRWYNAYEIYDEPVDVVGTVEEISATNSYTTRLLLKVENINGKSKQGYRFYAYTNKKDSAGIVQGTRISINATLTGFSEDSESYNISKGINAYASDVSNIKILKYTDSGISGRLAYIKEYLTRYTILISDKDSGAILSALLLGERDYLPDQIRLDFKRIGISHILALSGMHLAIISVMIERLLSLLKLNKKYRLAITIIFVLLYMALTGFSSSVVRSGIMVILSCVLFLLSRSKDSMTSLCVAVFIICLIKPHLIYDISLQLSALSTFGIIAYVEYSSMHNPMKNQSRVVKYLFGGIAVSIFAISSTIWISSTTFGGFSIVAPLATLVFSVLVELIMNLGCVMLLIGSFIPIGRLIKPLCTLLTYLSASLSSQKWVYVSSGYKLVSILIIIYSIVFFSCVILKIKRHDRMIGGLITFFVVILIITTTLNIKLNSRENIVYSSGYKSDEIIVRSEHEICLINSSQYSKSQAYESLDFLNELHVSFLDKYYITHYSWSIEDDLKVLLSNVHVSEIYIPEPRNEDEKTILKVLIKAIKDYRTAIYTFNDEEYIVVGDYSIELLYSSPYGQTSVNSFRIIGNEINYTYFSSGIFNLGKKFDAESFATDSDYIIFGSHGQKYKETLKITNVYPEAETIIVNSENVLISDDVINSYINSDCEIISCPDQIIYFK